MKFTWLSSTNAGVVVGWIRLMEALFLLGAASVGLNYLIQFETRHLDNLGSSLLQQILASIGIVFFGLDAIASSLLIIGTIKKKHVLLVPWIVDTILGIIASIVVFIIAMIHAAGLFSLFLFLHTAFHLAFCVPIYCVYKKITTSAEREGYVLSVPLTGTEMRAMEEH